MTEPFEGAVPAPLPVAFSLLLKAVTIARPSSSSGLAKSSRQISKGFAGPPLLTTAGGKAPNYDFFSKLIYANLQEALCEFLSRVKFLPTIDLPRLR